MKVFNFISGLCSIAGFGVTLLPKKETARVLRITTSQESAFELHVTTSQESDCEVITHNTAIKPVFYFTGREAELQELRQKIESGSQAILISGMGGIGKTHICRKLFEEYRDKHSDDGTGYFRYIGLIAYDGDMGSSLQRCIQYNSRDVLDWNQEAAWRELEHKASTGKMLLFVDNVDKYMKDDEGLQRLKSIPASIVLTSRYRTLDDAFESYELDFLSLEQCMEIYDKIRWKGGKERTAPEETQDLEYIIENMAGRHTKTVELFACLTRSKSWSVRRLREELEKNGFRLKFYKGEELVNIQEAYEVLYDLSELTMSEKNILEAFSVFPNIPIEAEKCNEWFLADPNAEKEDDVPARLYEKGWLQFDAEQESYSLHPVFAQFIYEKCRPSAEQHLGLIQACQACMDVREGVFMLEHLKYLALGKNIIEKLTMEKDMAYVRFVTVYARLLRGSGEYQKAKKRFEELLVSCQELSEEDNCDTADIYFELGLIHQLQADNRKAEEMYEECLKVRKKILGEKHKDTLSVYCSMATIYESRGKYTEAKKIYENSLRIYEKSYEDSELEIATIYNNLAGLCRRQRQYEKAVELHKKSLEIRERLFGENHVHTAIAYRNLAGIYLNMGQFRKAKELYEKSLNIYEGFVGEKHSDTALTYNDLGAAYYCLGRYKEAQAYHLKAYKIYFIKMGENHPLTKLCYNNLRRAFNRGRNIPIRGNKFKKWLEAEMRYSA